MSNRTCSVDDCNRPVAALDLCRKHDDAQRVKPPRVRDNNPRKCSVPGCVSGHSARGYCQAHYAQWRSKNGKPCSIEECHRTAAARGWCETHYSRWRIHGDPLAGDSEGKPCFYCGEPLPAGSKAGTRFCGYECRKNHYVKSKVAENERIRSATVKVCRHCDAEFVPEKSLANGFCSKKCSKNFHRDNSGKLCFEPGCDRPFRARGMCSLHWRRWARATGREKNPVWDERRKANWKKRYALTRGLLMPSLLSIPRFMTAMVGSVGFVMIQLTRHLSGLTR